jgi:hypothetical protein
MTDNLLDLNALKPDIILTELNNQTKRCAIFWDKISYNSFHCNFQWKGNWYDVYVTMLRNAFVFDMVRGTRNVLSINSYINDQVSVLYDVVSRGIGDPSNSDRTIKQIIQDLNSLADCQSGGAIGCNGGRKANAESLIGGLRTGGTSSVYMPNAFGIVYMANQNGNLELLTNKELRVLLTGLGNISCVQADRNFGKLFWAQVEINNTKPAGTKIMSADLNGGNPSVVLNLPDYDGVRSIALDRKNHKIYYAADKTKQDGSNLSYDVRKCNYDGSNIVSLADNNPYDCSPVSIEVDPDGGHVFWCDAKGLTEGNIYRSNLDGSGVLTLVYTSGYVRTISYYEGMLYLGGSGFLAVIDKDGNSEQILPHTGLSIIDSICVTYNRIFISDLGTKQIVNVYIDGSDKYQNLSDGGKRNSIALAYNQLDLYVGKGGCICGGIAVL